MVCVCELLSIGKPGADNYQDKPRCADKPGEGIPECNGRWTQTTKNSVSLHGSK
jgi:hypothetical protein